MVVRLARIGKGELMGSIYNGVARYYMRWQLTGSLDDYKDYNRAIREAFMVATHFNQTGIATVMKSRILKELYYGRMPIWWNVIKDKSMSLDPDELEPYDMAEASFIDRVISSNKIENIGEIEACLIVYLTDFLKDDELLKDPLALENFMSIYPFARYSGLINDKKHKEFEKVLNAVLENKEVSDWAKFRASGGELEYLHGNRLVLQDYKYWAIL